MLALVGVLAAAEVSAVEGEATGRNVKGRYLFLNAP
jgi:hypothetical protein